MLRKAIGVRLLSLAAVLALAAPARAVMVNYTANLSTSKGNPVTHLLILETDDDGPVAASVYPADVPGRGTAVISHNVSFQPTKSLLIGITEGQDIDGSDKTQLVMLLDPTFAAANQGIPFSSVFPGARHSETITKLLAAVAGDGTEIAWFTDTFFSGPAAGAAFETQGAFTVAEFTSLKVIGQNATAGEWMITSFQSLPANNPDAQSGKVTAVIGETAKINLGPFDIELSLNGSGVFAVDKSVLNDTDHVWTRFVFELGTGVGAAFVPSTPGDGLNFDDSLNNREETGAFPGVIVEEDRIAFSGRLLPGDTAHFVVFVNTATLSPHLATVRQTAVAVASPAPVLGWPSLALLIVVLGTLASFRLRRTHATASPS